MTQSFAPWRLDALIHAPARLGIMSALASAGSAAFLELKNRLRLTDGNLSAHARTLEKAGYISISKAFVDRKPKTTLSLTSKGSRALRQYLRQFTRVSPPR